MDKKELLKILKHVSDTYFEKKDFISAGQINLAMDVIEDYDGSFLQPIVRKNVFEEDVKEFVDEISSLSKYNSDHEKILDNFGDIGMVVKRFKQKHYL